MSYLRFKNIQGTIVKFFNCHTMRTNTQKGFLLKKSFFNWKHQKKLICLWNFFFKKLIEKSHIAEKPKEGPFRLIKRFLQTENFKKIKGTEFKNSSFDRIRKSSEKSCIMPKKSKGGPFGLHSTFGSIKKFCGLLRNSNPRSPASQTPEN